MGKLFFALHFSSKLLFEYTRQNECTYINETEGCSHQKTKSNWEMKSSKSARGKKFIQIKSGKNAFHTDLI